MDAYTSHVWPAFANGVELVHLVGHGSLLACEHLLPIIVHHLWLTLVSTSSMIEIKVVGVQSSILLEVSGSLVLLRGGDSLLVVLVALHGQVWSTIVATDSCPAAVLLKTPLNGVLLLLQVVLVRVLTGMMLIWLEGKRVLTSHFCSM